MPCYNPIIAKKTKKGTQAKILKLNLTQTKNIINSNSNKYQKLPCRKCIGCKLEHAQTWGVRAHLENLTRKEQSYFITLTYSKENLPKNKNGEPTIKKTDLQLFTKNLRELQKYHFNIENIKYLASAEYGSKTKRPHFHICYFGIQLNDLIPIKTQNETQLYVSKTIDKIWKKGFHTIGITTKESASYVARYTLKKQSQIKYKELEIEPEKLFMSKGLALKYYEKNKDILYKTDKIIIENKQYKLPKYFDRKYELENPKKLEMIKKRRQANAKITNKQKKDYYKLPTTEIYAQQQKTLIEKAITLKRNLKNKKD